jgi:hypothetical protein
MWRVVFGEVVVQQELLGETMCTLRFAQIPGIGPARLPKFYSAPKYFRIRSSALSMFCIDVA